MTTYYHYRARGKPVLLGFASAGVAALLFLWAALGIAQAAPVLSNIDTETGAETATITWETDTPSTAQISYGTTTSYGTFSAIVDNGNTEHSITLTNLEPDTLYNFQILSEDGEGTTASANQTFTTAEGEDSDGPIISNLEATTTESSATITWDTDEPALSQVQYGLSEGELDDESLNLFTAAQTSSHSVTLSGLEPDTTYFYRAVSTDADDNTTLSDVETFTTLSDGDDEPSALDRFINALERLMGAFPGFQEQIQDFIDQLRNDDTGDGDGNGNGDDNGDGDNGNGDGDGDNGTANIEQDGRTIQAGTGIDFAGRGFGPEEQVRITLDGELIGTGFTNLAGSFTSGSLSVPNEPGTYTYNFEGQETGRTATATLTLE